MAIKIPVKIYFLLPFQSIKAQTIIMGTLQNIPLYSKACLNWNLKQLIHALVSPQPGQDILKICFTKQVVSRIYIKRYVPANASIKSNPSIKRFLTIRN